MDGNGNLEDAPLSEREQGLTRDQLIAGFVAEGQVVDLSVIWQGLTRGTLKANDHFTQGDWSYLVLREVQERSAEIVPVNSLTVIESVVRGGASKVAALELRCNETAIVAHTRRALSMMGLHCPVSRAPVLLLQAAYASQGAQVLARVARFDTRRSRLLVVSALRLAPAAAAVLSKGERDVVCGLLDGKTYTEIARARGRAVRTVANQLATVFRKLGVSGRLDLVRLLTVLARHGAPLSLPSPARRSGCSLVEPKSNATPSLRLWTRSGTPSSGLQPEIPTQQAAS